MREATNKILEMVEDGLLDRDQVIMACLKYMSEDDVADMARAIDPSANLDIVGIRPGEKIHEQMISPEDASSTYDCGDYFTILPSASSSSSELKQHIAGVRVAKGFSYTSDGNTEWMTTNELRSWLESNTDESGSIFLH